MKTMTCIGVVLALGAATPGVGQEALPPASGAGECALPDGWSDLAEQEPRFVVFGELHGTRQGPEFFGNLACALATGGERLLLAVELSSASDAALQAAWNLPADRFGPALVETGWAGRRDGIASEAMFAMLVRAHELKQQGLPIAVVAFNGAKDAEQARRFADLPGQGPHEAAQAENLADAARRGDYDRVLVLVGNLHARKDMVERSGVAFEPMARRLATYGKTVTLDMRFDAGTAWNCLLKPGVRLQPGRPVPSDAIDCANHRSGGNAAFDRPAFVALGAFPEGSSGEYDGIFWVGPISGSSPQVATPDRQPGVPAQDVPDDHGGNGTGPDRRS